MKDFPPLLVTASLDPGRTPQVTLSDVRERTLRHMEGLLVWLKQPWTGRVVFAKNCTLPVRQTVLSGAAARHGKELEFVQVSSSPLTAIQGKGYGEGDLIRQALEKSEVLRCTRDFIKITGKLFMPDARSVFTGEGEGEFFDTGARNDSAVFPTRLMLKSAYRFASLSRSLAVLKRCRVPWGCIAAVTSGWIDTRCYRSNVDFYRERLLRSHERVQDALGYTLENAVFDDLAGVSGIRAITSSPVIIGASGTLGTSASFFPEEVTGEAFDLAGQLLSS